MLLAGCSGTLDIPLPRADGAAAFGVVVSSDPPVLHAMPWPDATTEGLIVDVDHGESLFVVPWPHPLEDYDVAAGAHEAFEPACGGGRPLPVGLGVYEMQDGALVRLGRRPGAVDAFRLPDLRFDECTKRGRCVVLEEAGARCADRCPAAPAVLEPEPVKPPNVVLPSDDCPAGSVAFVGGGCRRFDDCPAGLFPDVGARSARYVDPDAAGDGSMANPYGTIAEAVAQVPTAGVVALARKRHVIDPQAPVVVARAVEILGACPAETIVDGPLTIATTSVTISRLTLAPASGSALVVGAGHGLTLRDVELRDADRGVEATGASVVLERVVARGGQSIVSTAAGSHVEADHVVASGLSLAAFYEGQLQEERGTVVATKIYVTDSFAVLRGENVDYTVSEAVALDLTGPFATAGRRSTFRDVLVDGTGSAVDSRSYSLPAAFWVGGESEPVEIERMVVRNVRGAAFRFQDSATVTDLHIDGAVDAASTMIEAAGIEIHDSRDFRFTRLRIENVPGRALGVRCDDEGSIANGILDLISVTLRNVHTGLCLRNRNASVDGLLVSSATVGVDLRDGFTLSITNATIEDWREAGLLLQVGRVRGSQLRFLGGAGPAIRVAPRRGRGDAESLQIEGVEIDGAPVGLEVEGAPEETPIFVGDGVFLRTATAAALPCGFTASEVLSNVALDEGAMVRVGP